MEHKEDFAVLYFKIHQLVIYGLMLSVASYFVGGHVVHKDFQEKPVTTTAQAEQKCFGDMTLCSEINRAMHREDAALVARIQVNPYSTFPHCVLRDEGTGACLVRNYMIRADTVIMLDDGQICALKFNDYYDDWATNGRKLRRFRQELIDCIENHSMSPKDMVEFYQQRIVAEEIQMGKIEAEVMDIEEDCTADASLEELLGNDPCDEEPELEIYLFDPQDAGIAVVPGLTPRSGQ